MYIVIIVFIKKEIFPFFHYIESGEVFFFTESHSLFVEHLIPARDGRNTYKRINRTKPFFFPLSLYYRKCVSLAFFFCCLRSLSGAVGQ